MSQSPRTMPLMILTAAALFSGVAGAETRSTPAKPATAKTSMAVHSKTVTARPTAAIAKPAIVAKPALPPVARPVAFARPAAAASAPGRMVTTRTSTGKTVTYNCSKAGNLNKKACK